LIRVAQRAIASLYGLDPITDYDEHRHTLEHLLDNNTYMLCAVGLSLPVDVHCLHLASHVFVIADGSFSQWSASPQFVVSVPVGYLSCHDFAIAFLTVVSHSYRLRWIPPPPHTQECRCGRYICCSWGGFGLGGPGGRVVVRVWAGCRRL
jgi:hypothetical protein